MERLMLLGVAVLCIQEVRCQVPLTWTKVATATTPSARKDAAMGFDPVSKQLVLFGGQGSDSTALGDTWKITVEDGNPSSDWQLVPGTGPSPRWGSVYGMHSSGLVLAMGKDDATFYNDVWQFNLITNSWTLLKEEGASPKKRVHAAGGIYSTSSQFLYVTHGRAEDELLSDTVAFDLSTNSWKTVFEGQGQYSVTNPHARYRHAAAMYGTEKMVLFGGCLSGDQSGGPCPSKDVWRINEEGEWDNEEWCPLPRVSAMFTLYGPKYAILHGGESFTDQTISLQPEGGDIVFSLDLEDHKWTKHVLSGNFPERREGASMTQGGQGFICMFGGYIGEVGFQDELWCLTGRVEDTPTVYGCQFSLITPVLHGVMMFTAWGVLLQGGGIIARFFRLSGRWWVRTHRLLQTSGTVVAFIGFGFGIAAAKDHFSTAHGGIGLILMIGLFVQILTSYLAKRSHRHKDKSQGKSKPIGEIISGLIHRWTGRLLLPLSIINIILGIFLIVSPLIVITYTIILLAVLLFSLLALEYRLWRLKRSGKGATDTQFSSAVRRRSSDPWGQEQRVASAKEESTV